MIDLTFIPAAFLAGVLMFLAPCTLPIVPGYLAFIAGSPTGARSRGRIVRNAFAFVLGFSIIFVLLGVFAAGLGGLLAPWRDSISRIAGGIIILFGFTMLGVIHVPGLMQEFHVRIPKFLSIGRWESSMLIGALFALGWSPCIGPVLGTIFLFASISSSVLQGALLLAVFSVGLGIPFILSAVFLSSAQDAFVKWGKATDLLSYIGALILIAVGILMVLGDMGLLISWGYGLFNFVGYDRLLDYL